MNKRIILALVAALAVIAGLLVPAAQADALSTSGTVTGTVKVQLTNIQGNGLGRKGYLVSVSGVNINVYKEAITKSNGQATFKLKPGKYTFQLKPYRTDGGIKNGYLFVATVSPTIAISRGESKVIGLKLIKGGAIAGTLKNANGTPMKNATVAIARRSGVVMGYSTTDSKGHYTIRGIATGRYVVVFNYRSWGVGSTNVTSWSTTYYGGKTLGTAKLVQAYAQNQFAGSVTVKGVNGKATRGLLLSVSVATKNDANGQVQVERLNGTNYVQADSVYAPFDKTGQHVSIRIHPGYRYRIAVTYKGVKYFSQGAGKPLTKNPAKAVLTLLSGSSASIALGARP